MKRETRQQFCLDLGRFFACALSRADALVSTEGKIIRASRNLARVFGRPRRSLQGWAWAELCLEEDRPLAAGALEQLAAGRPVAPFLLRAKAQAPGAYFLLGRRQQIQQKSFIVFKLLKESAKGPLSFHHPQNANCWRQQHLTRSTYASQMALVSKMAGSIAHEINNPLAIIQGHAQRLDHLAGGAPTVRSEEIRQSMQKIIKALARASSIVHGLCCSAHQGRHDPLACHQLVSVAKEALKMSRGLFKTRGILINFDIDHHLQAYCRGHQVSQIIFHLLANSYEAIEAMPRLRHELDYIALRARRNGNTVLLEIEDNGPGVPAELRDQLFGPFVSSKSFSQGAGIGLSIAKGLIEAQAGRIELLCPERPTRFLIELPAARPQRQMAA